MQSKIGEIEIVRCTF